MKVLRNLIIGIALILLIPNLISTISSLGPDLPKEVRQQIKSGSAKQVNLDKKITLDKDILHFKKLIISENETLLLFKVHRHEPGWSFPDSALKLKVDKEKTLQYEGGSSSGETLGELIINRYEPLPKEAASLKIEFLWYDRTFETEFSIKQGGR